MNMLNRNCKMSFAKPEFLKKAQRVNPRLYDIGCYNDNLAFMLAPKCDETIREYYYADHMNAILGVYTTLDEFTDLQCDYVDQVVKCERLEKKVSKSKTMSKSFEALQKYAINLELALQQCKEHIKNDKAFKENQSNVFLKEREQYFEIQDLKAKLQDKEIAISELKKLIEKMKGKYVETKFEKSSVSRQLNAFKSQRQSVLGKPSTFSDSLAKTDFSKSKVIPTTSVSRPQLKSNQLEDKVMLNNSQGKKQEVKDHRRNYKFSNNKTFVTACNDSLNAKTLNVNFVCVTCGKCVLNENHDMYVLHYINGVNSRTKMPMVVPINTREHKQTMNQSAATPFKRIIAAESTNQKPRSTIRKQYEQISKTCRWWYCKITPPGYKWKPRSPIGNVNTNVSMPLGNASRTANILEPMTPRTVRTDKGTKFLNKTLHAYFAQEGIEHQTSTAQTPKQNDIVERRNCTLVEAARTMISAAKVPFQENVPQAVETVTTSNELDLLFSLMFDELLNGTTQVVSKSSTVTTIDAPNQRQQQHTTPSTSTTVAADTPLLNIQTTPETTSQAPTQAPTVTATENINQAKTNKENSQVEEDEFINIFSTPVQEREETSSRHVDSSNMHTFYQ
ncbi:reverse transcriptase domain-containing protein [Tanacetum coccineum]|uniref:Reverse transcriptase domain-containing protein n=1 Tax=Tanacetum coccineum TaxID=301880 RepID=A0ABQ5EBN4_9ASTR